MKQSEKLKLIKDGGPIVFLGSMNAMPMMYAYELKKLGYEVIYFVDSPSSNKLNRPENHFPDITYPYPDWIIELNIPSQMLVPYFRGFFVSYMQRKIKGYSSKNPQLYFLNGFFVSLSSLLAKNTSKVIALSHGSDMDSWADTKGIKYLSENFSRYSFYKFLPKTISCRLISIVVERQYKGFCGSDLVVYFPKGFNESGDRVIKQLIDEGVTYYGRYDISFDPLKNESRDFKENSNKLVIFSGVRFTYKTFSEGNGGYSKGNDIIIKGLAKFYKQYKDIEIHFVEKGPDVADAKVLCDEVGLKPVVFWHKEMTFKELLSIYANADICFDQVGMHWIGAIGGYALWLGKPLIANDKLAVSSGIWPKSNPVLSAGSVDEVYRSLKILSLEENRRKISYASKEFVGVFMSPTKFIHDVLQLESD